MACGKALIAAAAAAVLLAAAPAPTAAAAPSAIATPGMAIFQTTDGHDSRCTLGYTARNAENDRLAVTAGHCGGAPGQPVYDQTGRPIGQFIAVQPDNLDERSYGYALIRILPAVALSAWITPSFAVQRHAQGGAGDYVCIFGTTSGMQCSTIKTVTLRAGTITGTLSKPGDSGAPVIRMRDHALVGIVIGHNAAAAETLFEPIAGVITLAAAHSDTGTAFGPVVDDADDSR